MQKHQRLVDQDNTKLTRTIREAALYTLLKRMFTETFSATNSFRSSTLLSFHDEIDELDATTGLEQLKSLKKLKQELKTKLLSFSAQRRHLQLNVGRRGITTSAKGIFFWLLDPDNCSPLGERTCVVHGARTLHNQRTQPSSRCQQRRRPQRSGRIDETISQDCQWTR